MKRSKILLMVIGIAFIAASFSNLLFAKEKEKKQTNLKYQQLYGKPFLKLQPITVKPEFIIQPSPQNLPKPDPKSLKKGLLFSLLIPGSGEIYARSWIKGVAFLGMEIGMWYLYANHHGKGNDIKKQFQQYANENWSREKWQQWYDGLDPETKDQYAHHELPETKTQQYYEMIGKYQKFNAGWRDMWENDPNFLNYDINSDTSALSLYYMGLRGKSNNEYKKAMTASYILLLNHVISALDAAWTVNRFNREIETSVKMNYVIMDNEPQTMATLTVKW